MAMAGFFTIGCAALHQAARMQVAQALPSSSCSACAMHRISCRPQGHQLILLNLSILGVRSKGHKATLEGKREGSVAGFASAPDFFCDVVGSLTPCVKIINQLPPGFSISSAEPAAEHLHGRTVQFDACPAPHLSYICKG
jgi:hypothetical protein